MAAKKTKLTDEMIIGYQTPIRVEIEVSLEMSESDEEYDIEEWVTAKDFDQNDFLYYVAEDLANYISDIGEDGLADNIVSISIPEWMEIK